MTGLPPAQDTKTWEVFAALPDDEWLTAAEVSNRVPWVDEQNYASAVSHYLQDLEHRGLVDVNRDPSPIEYKRTVRLPASAQPGGAASDD